jgi:carboxyl-terminal processing protease
VAITDLFLDPGKVVVETRGRAPDQSEVFSAQDPQAYPDLPLVILVDERSASASEIIAGALQDHDRAVVVGAPTFGKGSVQTLFPLTGGNILRLTTARWFTPVGRSIHKDRDEQIAAMERSAITLGGFLATRPDTVARPAYRTDGGRSVLGGGGITPDVLVVADTLTTDERDALRELDRSGGGFNTAVFNFAVAYRQGHPALGPGFSLTAAEMEEFRARLSAAGVELSAAAFRRAARFIRFQLEGEIALQAWGEAGEFQRGLAWDRALQRALRLLEQAEGVRELLTAAALPGLSDWAARVAVAGEDRSASEGTSPPDGEGGSSRP